MLGPDRGRQLKAFARVGSVGIELALSTVVGLLGGQWLDEKLSTAPWLTVIGLLLGVTAGFRSLIQAARRKPRSTDDSPPDDKPE